MEKLYNFLTNLELIDLQAIEENQAFASVNLNPNITWGKFTLTDDLPNENKQRVPLEEYDNLVNSGVYMPIKMVENNLKGDHYKSKPLGTIAHLKVEGNQVKGLAALWNQERPEDLTAIKEAHKEGKPIRLSWELAYSTAELEEDGTSALRGVSLLATVIVGKPAYGDRTRMEAFSSTDTDETEEKIKMEHEKEIEGLTNSIRQLEEDKVVLQASLDTKLAEASAIQAELDSLREFKSIIEKEQQEAEKLLAIREKFTAASIVKDSEYFVANKGMLLSLTDSAMEFMLQELASGLKATASSKTGSIPNVPAEKLTEVSIKELAEKLRNRN